MHQVMGVTKTKAVMFPGRGAVNSANAPERSHENQRSTLSFLSVMFPEISCFESTVSNTARFRGGFLGDD